MSLPPGLCAPRRLTASVLRRYRQADPAIVRAGLAWYDQALAACEQLAYTYDRPVVTSVVACAHLSPRRKWAENLALLELLLAGKERPPWALARSWDMATRTLDDDDPLGTFGRYALKTRAFAEAILGDRQAVVVDIWAARAAEVPEHTVRSVSGYLTVADAYRRGAKRIALAPRDLQAVVWCAQRGTSE